MRHTGRARLLRHTNHSPRRHSLKVRGGMRMNLHFCSPKTPFQVPCCHGSSAPRRGQVQPVTCCHYGTRCSRSVDGKWTKGRPHHGIHRDSRTCQAPGAPQAPGPGAGGEPCHSPGYPGCVCVQTWGAPDPSYLLQWRHRLTRTSIYTHRPVPIICLPHIHITHTRTPPNAYTVTTTTYVYSLSIHTYIYTHSIYTYVYT